MNISLDEVRALANEVLKEAGAGSDTCRIIADVVTTAERDGPESHGLNMLLNYADSIKKGWSNGHPRPVITKQSNCVLRVDADNGYAQIATSEAQNQLIKLAQSNGIAMMLVHNSHHIGALRYDVEPLAEAGLIAIAMTTSRPWVTPHGGTDNVFGTNPMAFSCPRAGKNPIVWDQASSVIAITDLKMAAASGERLHSEAGIDMGGNPSKNAADIVEAGKLMSFGGHKGTAIALMIEVLGGVLAGGVLSLDDEERQAADAFSGKAGLTVIAIDSGPGFDQPLAKTVARLSMAFENNGSARVPGDGRLKRRIAANEHGVDLSDKLFEKLQNFGFFRKYSQ